ncbi:LysR family transcriptional regulator [Marinobacter mobilis]|uniref:DNA-binding transcriptional regulator, LysR family n=1 Tax=Marinobacter mobilis TaxID=488533 RepID=A0A1H2WVV3_9GAMM|nr:LysR family transcriptional regulator [Marinobacter mobilis]SDW84742.1 DNA-binding transcriptional regulator, LysR family [Marinobacter mobilis]
MNPIDTFNLDARALRVLLAVLDDGTVSGAAVKLGLSQSAVSHTLDRLRQVLGDPLFVKSGRGIVPTNYTLRIGPHVRQILDDLRSLSAGPPFDPRDAEFTFTVAANDYQRDLLLPPLMQTLRRQAPGIALQVIPSGIPSADMLRKEVCDLIISPHPPAASDVLQRRLLDDQMVIFYDPTQRSAPTTLAEYLQANHIAILFGTGERMALEGSLSAQGLERKVTVTVSNFSGLPGFLRGSQLLATAPRRMSEHLLKGFASTPLPFDFKPFSLLMLWHQRNHGDPAHRWLRQQLIDVAQQRKK